MRRRLRSAILSPCGYERGFRQSGRAILPTRSVSVQRVSERIPQFPDLYGVHAAHLLCPYPHRVSCEFRLILVASPAFAVVGAGQADQRVSVGLAPVARTTQQDAIGDVVRTALRTRVDVVYLHERWLQLPSAPATDYEVAVLSLRLFQHGAYFGVGEFLPRLDWRLHFELEVRYRLGDFVGANRRLCAIVDIPKGE